MSGDQIYSKSVDIWAVGFIMYELIALRHPLWTKYETKESYRETVLNFKKLRYGHRFNKYTKSLIQTMCHPKPSCRYTVDQALQHPWITRDFTSEIPRTYFENSMYLEQTDEKLRKVIGLVYFMTVIKNQTPLRDHQNE